MDVEIAAALIGAAPSAFLSVTAIAAGSWAVHNYNNTRRLEAARWVQQLYTEFYNSDRFDDLRLSLEYAYYDDMSFLIQKRLTNRDLALSREEMQKLRHFDNFLNYFENLLYLLEQKRVQRRDVMAIFDYWFSLMRADRCGALRGYLAFGFERLAKELNAKPVDHLFLTDAQWSVLQSARPDLCERFTALPNKSAETQCLADHAHATPEFLAIHSGGSSPTAGRMFKISASPEPLALVRLLDEVLKYQAHALPEGGCLRFCVRTYEKGTKRPPAYDAWVYALNHHTLNEHP